MEGWQYTRISGTTVTTSLLAQHDTVSSLQVARKAKDVAAITNDDVIDAPS
jgi:hypothetical protein